MNTRWLILGIIIFAIAGYVFVTGYQGIQGMVMKFDNPFSQEKYEAYKIMESIGGIAAVIGLLIALAGIVEKDK
jgi:hypothetical protein